MPVHRIIPTIHRSSPLAKTSYVIPPALPAPFGVGELFDWSSTGPSSFDNSSPRSCSSNSSTFMRWKVRSTASSLKKWIDEQDTLANCQKTDHRSDTLSISSTSTGRRPLPHSGSPFQPSLVSSISSTPSEALRVPLPSSRPTTPPKPGSSNVSLQLPSPVSSPVRPPRKGLHSAPALRQPNRYQKTHGPTSMAEDSELEEEFVSATDGRMVGGAGYQNTEDIAESDEPDELEDELEDELDDELEDELEGELEDELEDEDEEDSDAELSVPRRNPISVYLDDEATEARKQKNPKQLSTFESGHHIWTGASKGTMPFRKRPKGEDLVPAAWTFSKDGVERQSFKGRDIGDVHFSPGYSGGMSFDYWVLVDRPKLRWAMCEEGQAHPVLEGYVLKTIEGSKPPQWIRAQSLRANKAQRRSRG